MVKMIRYNKIRILLKINSDRLNKNKTKAMLTKMNHRKLNAAKIMKTRADVEHWSSNANKRRLSASMKRKDSKELQQKKLQIKKD